MAGVVCHGAALFKLHNRGIGAADHVKCRKIAAVVAPSVLSRRSIFSGAVLSIPLMQLVLQDPAAALIDYDDDPELLEQMKQKKAERIAGRGRNLTPDETDYLQNAVLQLRKAGRAIENDNFQEASSVLGTGLDAPWVANTKSAFAKVSTNSGTKDLAEQFTSSLASLQSAGEFLLKIAKRSIVGNYLHTNMWPIKTVSKQDAKLSKSAFVASATALEKWASLTGLAYRLKGL